MKSLSLLALLLGCTALSPGMAAVQEAPRSVSWLIDSNKFDEAEQAARAVLKERLAQLGPDAKETLVASSQLGEALLLRKKAAEAEPLLAAAYKGLWKPQVITEESLEAASALGGVYVALGKLDEAAPILSETLRWQQKLYKSDSPALGRTFERVAALAAAERKIWDAEKAAEKASGSTEPKGVAGPTREACDAMAQPVERCVSAWAYGILGLSDAAAEAQLRRAIALGERLHAEGKGSKYSLDSAYWSLFSLYQRKGRYAEAEPVARLRSAFVAANMGENDTWHMNALSDQGENLTRLGRVEEADRVFARALALDVGVSESAVSNRITLWNRRGVNLRRQGRLNESSEMLFTAAKLVYRHLAGMGLKNTSPAAIKEWLAARPKDDVMGIVSLYNGLKLLNDLAVTVSLKGEKAEALKFLEEAVTFGEASNSPHALVEVWNNHGMILSDLKRPAEAVLSLEKASRLAATHFDVRHPDRIAMEGNLGYIQLHELNRPDLALPHLKQASSGLVADMRASLAPTEAASRLRNAENLFRDLVAANWTGKSSEGGAQAFEAAQWAMSGEAAAALARVAARFASGKDEIGRLETRRQELNAERAAAEAEYYRAQGAFANATKAGEASKLLAEIDRQTAAVSAQISALDPAYDDLIRPSVLSITETQRLLKPDEGLLLFVVDDRAAFTFAVTREGFSWFRNDALGAKSLRTKVDRLRQGLQVESARGLERVDAGPTHFERALAFELYEGLIAPAEALLKGKKTVLAVRDGPLQMLPLHLLVTERPSGTDGDPAALAGTTFLLDDKASTVLPAVSSLKALRCLLIEPSKRAPGCGAAGARKPRVVTGPSLVLAGFGAPILSGAPGVSRSGSPLFEQAFKGQLADTELLRRLPDLPGSLLELTALSKEVGSGAAVIRTGAEATESSVKDSGDLARARYVVFSTHGLVSSETGQSGEPGLVFTPPPFAARSDRDDGLLTASEAARLKLSAEFVILSACNTAAPSGVEGGDGLTGLARSFFFAGARSLLVSHWPVDDNATSKLIVGTFKRMEGAGQGRPEAFRQAMLAVRKEARWSSPAFWAPFEVVGAD